MSRVSGTPATPDVVSHDPHDTAAPAGVQPQVAASGVDGLLQHDAASSGCDASSSATDAYELGPGMASTTHVPPRGVASSSNVPHAPPPQHDASVASTPPFGVDARPPSVVLIPPVANEHSMMTRGKHGFR